MCVEREFLFERFADVEHYVAVGLTFFAAGFGIFTFFAVNKYAFSLHCLDYILSNTCFSNCTVVCIFNNNILAVNNLYSTVMFPCKLCYLSFYNLRLVIFF